MASIIKIKRSSTTAAPSSLQPGELAYSEVTQNLFFGSAAGVLKIGGFSDVQKLANATSNNVGGTLVERDEFGAFSAGDITVGAITSTGLVSIANGQLTTTSPTVSLFNTNATTANVLGAATSIFIGATTGTTTIRNDLTVNGTITIVGDTIVNGNTQYVGDTVFEGDIAVNGGDITTIASTASLFAQPNVTSLTLGSVGNTTLYAPTTVVKTNKTIALGSPTIDAFSVVDSQNVPLFQVKENGDTVIGGILTVNGTGTSTFMGDVSINGNLLVSENATVTAAFNANDITVTGNLNVHGNTVLGDDAAVDTTTLKGATTVQTRRTKAAAKAAFDANGAGALFDAFRVVDSAGAPLFEVKDNGDTVIAGILTVNGEGTSTFAGDVAIGGSITVAENATVTMDFAANSATISGNLNVNGNTVLGNEATDTTNIVGKATISTGKTFAQSSSSVDAFAIKTADDQPLFQVKENGDTVIGGILTVNGVGTSTFAGDVSIGGSLTVAENATVTMDLSANDVVVTGNLAVNGNTSLGNDANDTTTVTGSFSTTGNAAVGGNLTVSGNLTVNGTTTTVNSTTTTLTDPVLSLAKDTSAADSYDRGIDFKYHDGSAVKLGFFGWDDSKEVYTFLTSAAVTDGEYAGSAAKVEVGAIAGVTQNNVQAVLSNFTIEDSVIDGGTF